MQAPRGDSPHLSSRTWPDVGRTVLLVPLGSTEQHGPHLPLSTDTFIAAAVADDLDARCRAEHRECLVAPPLVFGSSGEHEGFAGTVSIGTDALASVLLELGRSASAWAERIVFVNAHGGNLDALTGAVPALRSEGRDAAWLPAAPPHSTDAHAGFDETSLMLHLRPADVRLERAETGATAPIADLLPHLRAEGVRGVSPNGVLGDPTGASAEHGARLFAAMCDAAWLRYAHGAVGADGCLGVPPLDEHSLPAEMHPS